MCRWLWRYLNQVHFFSSHISSLSRTQNFISCPNTRTGLDYCICRTIRKPNSLPWNCISLATVKTGYWVENWGCSGSGFEKRGWEINTQTPPPEPDSRRILHSGASVRIDWKTRRKCVLTVNDRRLNICGKRLLSLTEVERRWELLLRYGTLNIIIMEGRRWGRVRWS